MAKNRNLLPVSRLPLGLNFEDLSYPTWTHPQVLDNVETWTMIRDCVKGERAVKQKARIYLPPMDEMTPDEYAAYLDRAAFFNMSGRTVSALTGMVFQRSPKVTGVPKSMEKAFKAPTRTGITFSAFLKAVCRELIKMGRYGVLLDMDKETRSGNRFPYFAGYTAENILDWTTILIDGIKVLSEVVVREIEEAPREFGKDRSFTITYRRLALEWSEQRNDYVYVQYIYESNDPLMDVATMEPQMVIPNRNGVPFNRIPFQFLGAIDNSPDVDDSPLSSIASMNVSHYKSYAQLEHARYYVAMPVYYAQVPQGADERIYRVGSGTVWECAPGETPGIIEMHGTGLVGLERACEQKEDQIASLGGRLMSGKSKAVAESDNSLRLKEGNERSILLNIVFCMNEGLTDLLQKWVWWAGGDKDNEAEVELNSEFLTDTLGARELRAVYAMYVDGVVPLTVVHHYLQKAEVIPDWMDVETLKGLLDDESEFKNQPDVIAKMKGFGTAKDQVDQRLKKRELRSKDKLADAAIAKVEETARANKEDEKIKKKQAETQAKVAQRPQPQPNQQQQQQKKKPQGRI